MALESGTLVLGNARGGQRYFLLGRPLNGGDVVQLCCSGGWITGRFEWDEGSGGAPTFYFSIELEGGAIAQRHLELPTGALLRWA